MTPADVYEKAKLYDAAAAVAAEQVDPNGELLVADVEPFTVVEGLLHQELRRLHEALGLEWPG